MHKIGWTLVPSFSVPPYYRIIHPNLWPKDAAVTYHENRESMFPGLNDVGHGHMTFSAQFWFGFVF